MTDFATAKHNMIEQQIRPWEVFDPQVLDTLNQIDRDHYVSEVYKAVAYADCCLPSVDGGTMLPPTIEGRMLQSLKLTKKDLVLEIGTGNGYITACLATLATQVTSLDFSAKAAEMAAKNLADNGIGNINLQTISSISEITPIEQYDAITVTAGSIETVPDNLKNALTIGGRLFVICGQSPVQHAQLITRVGQTEWTTQSLFETDVRNINN